MIGKIVIGKSFGGCIKYCLNDKIPEKDQEHEHEQIMKDRAEVLLYNKCYGNERELIQQFNEVRQLNPRLEKPVLHITLSLSPEENIGKDKLMEMSEQCAKDLGFENNQYIAIHHRDTGHQHLHIVANRIGFDKKTVRDSNNYQKIANYCRKMEQQYELKQVLNPKKFLGKEQRNIPRFDRRKEQLKEHIKDALKGCSSFRQFEQRMKEKGIRIIKGRGISFADEKKMNVKGSELGYSLQTIERILGKQRTFQLHQQPNASAGTFRQELVKTATSTSRHLTERNNEPEKDKSTVLEQLMKPVQQHEGINNHFLQKKRKRNQHQSRHL